ncbi:hypothetical protein SKAU_G00395660 [Synaphobranchus kaupii]|uniref:Attractin-like protein 1 n=1 Tax=Synaphobranchus kaupii TaxID=118154 RepID=A0A9Q1IC10_SYNKA|nr:hypothetical protein SKAU_G00395660 [Synaphobranchus kaupii]
MDGEMRRAWLRRGVYGESPPGSALLLVAALLLLGQPSSTKAKECDRVCLNGQCNPATGSCLCDPGWAGDQCQHCGGRFRMTGSSGFLTDGPGNYKYKTKCTWLIEGEPNTILRLRFNHFATECSWDHLYVYDGDSIYSPLLAAFSGLIVPERYTNETVPEVVSKSGYTLLHFFSDAAYNLTGFNISYRINSCPNNCSGRGECRVGNTTETVYCDCEDQWKGEACDIPYCLWDCGFPERGVCRPDGTKGCLCHPGWQACHKPSLTVRPKLHKPQLGFHNTAQTGRSQHCAPPCPVPSRPGARWHLSSSSLKIKSLGLADLAQRSSRQERSVQALEVMQCLNATLQKQHGAPSKGEEEDGDSPVKALMTDTPLGCGSDWGAEPPECSRQSPHVEGGGA